MGTSNSYGGPGGGTPLVPSWLDGPILPPQQAPTSPDGKPLPNQPPSPQKPINKPDGKPVMPTPGAPDRFRKSRTNFTKFAKSGGKDTRALGRALSSYVSTTAGGSRRAAQRLGSSRAVTVRLADFLNSVQSQGVQQTLQSLNFQSYVGQSVEEIFIGLSNVICPDGGTVDEGIARNAFIETVADLAEAGITDLNSLTTDQINTIIEIFATHAIEGRLCNDIGTKIVIAPDNIKAIEAAQNQLHDFINRSVSDALNKITGDGKTIRSTDMAKLVDQIYEDSFSILQSLAEAESE